MPHQLQIVSWDDEEDIHVIATTDTERELERIEDGANINLDHARYYTRIVEVPS